MRLGKNWDRPGPPPLPKAAHISALLPQAGQQPRAQEACSQSLSSSAPCMVLGTPPLHKPAAVARWIYLLPCCLPWLASCLQPDKPAPACMGWVSSGGWGRSCITRGGGQGAFPPRWLQLHSSEPGNLPHTQIKGNEKLGNKETGREATEAHRNGKRD